MFETYAKQAAERNTNVLSGFNVWRLYDTFGFPVDLTRIMAEENGLQIDEEEFEKAKAESKEASKLRKGAGTVEVLKLDVHSLGELEKMDKVPKTDDRYKFGE
jgi:alanyl-tRNA synthetase